MQKILVIDDEAIIRETTAMALQRRGFETLEAGSGAEGADLALRLLPDLILSDVNMEEMDGFTLLDKLRHEPSTAAIPFILMTGMGDSETMRRGMDLGADDYLTKPFTASQLYSAIEARLKKSDLLRQNAEKKLAELRTNLSLALPHEMITPLNGIFGLAQILSTDAETLTPADVTEFGTNILQSAERLHRTVQNFLLFGQLEMQSSDPECLADLRQKSTDNLQEIIATRSKDLASEARRPDDLRLELCDGVAAIGSDLFTKLVNELVGNAFKFSTAGTVVKVVGAPGKGEYILSISDHGQGMTADQIADIGAYSQFNRKTNEQQGSGLGLAIVRHIAELHGGQINIRSEPASGTIVTIKLPA